VVSNEKVRNINDSVHWKQQADRVEHQRLQNQVHLENLRRSAIINTENAHSIEKSQLISVANANASLANA
jgi:hypothetical protein